jgi:3-hydroxyacyl-[acyl-carrier-protein] dehydratase
VDRGEGKERILNSMNIHAVLKHLPHRYPFLLIDRVLSCEPGKQIVALKNVTINEPFFEGHFPRYPVMPGVMIVEALAQASALLSFKTMEAQVDEESVYYFVGIDKARFKKPVTPGDALRLEVSLRRYLRGIWKFWGVATVEGVLVAEAELMCTVRALKDISGR